MKKSLPRLILLAVLASMIFICIFTQMNIPKYKLKDITGDKKELDDIVILTQEEQGLYNTRQTIFSKDNIKTKSFSKELPVMDEYSKLKVKNRDIFEASDVGNLTYKDDENIGFIEYKYPRYDDSVKESYAIKVNNKNLKTNKKTDFKVQLPSSIKYDWCGPGPSVVYIYNNEIYMAYSGSINVKHDEEGKFKGLDKGFIEIYKVNLDTHKISEVNKIDINNSEEKFNIVDDNIKFVNEDKMYFMVNSINKNSQDDKVESNLMYYDVKSNKFEYIKVPLHIKQSESDYMNISSPKCSVNENKLNIIVQEDSYYAKDTDIHLYSVDLKNEKIINEDKVYSIDKVRHISEVNNFKVINNKLYVTMNSHDKQDSDNVRLDLDNKYNIFVLDEKTKKLLYNGELYNGKRIYQGEYILKQNEL
ncbi:hypothetical protein CHF27_004175 [Romboutsia maritimum]|uniref:Uncharacterized protein n=1 Tax=Romboutsia maritimum TaxID=2020948 RepID=A0A371IUX3_9FIRM|nr:hypothetical protein [Romboutsia maritimum]RDY24287.1 hypothetical protein CHF27_004175 [Romboutsia maritimum]